MGCLTAAGICGFSATCLTDVTGGAEMKSHRLRHNLRLMRLAFCESETVSY